MNRAAKRHQKQLARKTAIKHRGARPRLFRQIVGLINADRLSDIVQDGMRCHAAGRLQDAETLYRRVLDADPDHADANHLLGGVAHQVGNHRQAVELISRAIEAAPDEPIYHFNLGTVYQAMERPEDAAASYREAVALKPDYAEAHNNLGSVLRDMERLEDAAASFAEALALRPEWADSHGNLGNALHELGRFDDAVASFRAALALNPDAAEDHYRLGNALQDLGRREDAAASYRQALALKPDHAGALSNLGSALQAMGQLERAVASYSQALAIRPDLAEAHYNLGSALDELDRREEAIDSYRQAIALKPDFAAAYSNLGNTLQWLGRLEESVDACRAALAITPDFAEMHGNLGTALQKLGRLEDAIASYQASLALQPENFVVWNNLRAAIKALEYPPAKGRASDRDFGARFSSATRATGGFARLEYELASYRPHEAYESYRRAMAALPARADAELTVDVARRERGEKPRLPDKLVALLHFGRSGTGLLHSLIDGHPEISTVPSIYLRGFFNTGVWESLAADGWRALPERFADLYEVMFDAASAKFTPGIVQEKNAYLGVKEGMTILGEGRDESLSVDREAFCAEALRLIEHYQTIDPKLFLLIVHAAYEKALGTVTEKHTTLYHIHNPDTFTKLNFLRHAPDARLLMMVREPVQSCESWVREPFEQNDYHTAGGMILSMFFVIDQIPFRTQDSVGVRLEDLKTRPKQTMRALCAWLGVEETPGLYEMTAQGKQWWGDPSSLDYRPGTTMSPFDPASIERPVGAVFSEADQFVLGTLFYPFSVRFGYREADPAAFRTALDDIKPLLDGMLDFETVMAERSGLEAGEFMRRGAYRLFRAGLMDRWRVLDELGDYPHMLTPLEIPGP